MKRSDSRYLLAPALGLVLGTTWLLGLALLAWPLDKSPRFSFYAGTFTALWTAGSAVLSWLVMRHYGVRRPRATVGAAVALTLVVSAFGYSWLPTLFAPFVFAVCFLVAAAVVDLVPADTNGPLRGRRPQGPVL